jgi:phage gpG-like protein
LNVDAMVSGADAAAAAAYASAQRAANLSPVLTLFGGYMKTVSIPTNFTQHGRPKKWEMANRWGVPTDDPLLDEGTLLRSVGYEAASTYLDIGAGSSTLPSLRKAAVLQYGTAGLPGGAIKPKKGKYLVRPIVGPGALTVSEARSAKPRDIPGLFVLSNAFGEALGLFRVPSGGGEPVMVYAFMTESKIPERPYLLFQEEDVAWFVDMAQEYIRQAP